ncbi:hypothetical protein HUT13_17245 [Streptomyces harbinensis]|uniref:cell division protein PerM n=1 Tax=Streptomyces harbinensis TaxID=1176198 RepID=UPI00159116B7|nr:DUF6350 family protein [Streptomyces harbinensis]QKV70319.1 hypothetical protein HUT13_17245 [Streptomyces harbinensis]
MRSLIQRFAPDGRIARTRWLGEGLVAAGLGFGVPAVIGLVLWTTSPFPDSGAGGALRVVAGLWLLAHGAELVRAETLSGIPAPIGLTPLLLTALPCWLLHRAVRVALIGERDPALGPRAALWVSAGYLLPAVPAALYTLGGPISVHPPSALLAMPLLTCAVALASAVSVLGWPAPWPDPYRLAAAGRAAVAGTAAVVGAGALLAAGALVLHADAAQRTFGQLSGPWSGQIAVLLLGLALAPNAAVWAAAYGLGPGFTLGAGSLLAPQPFGGGTGEGPRLPAFPLLAVAPGGTGGGWAVWAVAAVVPAAGIGVLAHFTARGAVRSGSGPAATALTALLAAVGCGVVLGGLATLAGGPLGTAALAEFGPDPLLTGAAGAAWGVVGGVPLALALRAWQLRTAGPWQLLTGRLWRWREARAEQLEPVPGAGKGKAPKARRTRRRDRTRGRGRGTDRARPRGRWPGRRRKGGPDIEPLGPGTISRLRRLLRPEPSGAAAEPPLSAVPRTPDVPFDQETDGSARP